MKTITIDGVEYELTPKSEPKKDRPEKGQQYWFVEDDEDINSYYWDNNKYDIAKLKLGNCFWGENARHQAYYSKLRLEAMAKRWKPEKGEDYYYYSLKSKKARSSNWKNTHEDNIDFFLGNIHKTEQEAEDWGENYHDAFMALFN